MIEMALQLLLSKVAPLCKGDEIGRWGFFPSAFVGLEEEERVFLVEHSRDGVGSCCGRALSVERLIEATRNGRELIATIGGKGIEGSRVDE